MMSEKIKEKIKKLLALSTSSNENESYAALTKAQALMVEYKISESELSTEETKKCISKETKYSYGTSSSNHYLNSLASIIAENFCCINYLTTVERSRTHRICFMGLQEDVSLCEEAMLLASTSIIKGYNRVWKSLCARYGVSYIDSYTWTPAKLGYIKGYLQGLKSVFDAQKEEHQEWGLVLVVPDEAKEYLDSLETVNYHKKRVSVDGYYYQDGYSDGKNFNMNKKIDNSNVLLIHN